MPEPPIKKRKRAAPKEEHADATDGLDAMEVFRRHFESQFAPLPEVRGARASKKKKKEEEELGKKEERRRKKASIDSVREDDADEDEGGSEWGGLSDGEGDCKPAAPEVIHFTSGDPLLKTSKLPKSILKPFMTTKPPSSSLHTAAAAAPPADTDDGDEGSATTEAQLRQNDLALQRLLRESHLLDANLEATGRNRLKAIEARVQALGGADLTKHKMPMAARVWMEKSRRAREEKRRREAREAGVVLEREVRVKKARGERERERERGAGEEGGLGRVWAGSGMGRWC